ncbi:MAG: DUF1294 domain-containing protein [Clostridia bacterium]|nr:DUF1294 domain-containing protein [Clostridia bacterium]
MEKLLFVYLVLINVIAAAVCVVDKQKAIKRRLRISEKTLFALSIIGGSFGFFLAMQTVHHKTKHTKFMLGIPLIILVQALGIYFLLTKL